MCCRYSKQATEDLRQRMKQDEVTFWKVWQVIGLYTF